MVKLTKWLGAWVTAVMVVEIVVEMVYRGCSWSDLLPPPSHTEGWYWAVLGCTGLHWAVLAGNWLYWAVLGGIGPYFDYQIILATSHDNHLTKSNQLLGVLWSG